MLRLVRGGRLVTVRATLPGARDESVLLRVALDGPEGCVGALPEYGMGTDVAVYSFFGNYLSAWLRARDFNAFFGLHTIW